MRKLLAIAALVTSTLLIPGVVPAAHAGHDWFAIGSAFRVGAAHISFVFGRPLAGIGPAYYFQYDRPISYDGYNCNRYCFRDSGNYYHHEACPVVGAHFSRYDSDPYSAFSRYAPRFDGYEGHRGGYDRQDGYDRGYRNSGPGYGRYEGHGGYDRHDGHRNRGHNRHHQRRHRHGPSCHH